MEDEIKSLDLSNLLDPDEYAGLERENGNGENKETDGTEAVDAGGSLTAGELFGDDSGGGEKKNTGDGASVTDEKAAPAAGGNTPIDFSSIASAFKADGVALFNETDDEKLKGIRTPEDFESFLSERVEALVNERLGEQNRRLSEALNGGMPADELSSIKAGLTRLQAIKPEDLDSEDASGEELRKQLIYMDFINRGYSPERAGKKTKQSFDAGTDKDDAKDALEAGKEYYRNRYEDMVEDYREEAESRKKQEEESVRALEASILDDKSKVMGESVGKATREKIRDFLLKPAAKTEDGQRLTELQKYIRENRDEYMKNVGWFYVMTDGFKSLDRMKAALRSEVDKKRTSALESALRKAPPAGGGPMQMLNTSGDVGSGGKGWQLDI